MKLIIPFILSILACHVQAKAVFAPTLCSKQVTNAANYTDADYTDDITKAKDAHIDAFALNMAKSDPVNSAVVRNFFRLASSIGGFQLFFSFDYAGNGPWNEDEVISFINQYASSSAYYHYNSQPFVSTFEGPGSAADWYTIKAATGCFFVPDWSSMGAKAALGAGSADGLFSWAGWPWGPQNMTTYVDASYIQYLGDLPYMMPASPWFYTNLPGYDKNWMWRGDDLWFDRWQEILFMKPPFVEIISWNDYGESHYIGPLRDYAMEAFTVGKAPFNYVKNMPHDGWRLFLPYLIDLYKTGTATVTNEGLSVWHRLSPAAACSDGGTSGNTASQLQIEFKPAAMVDDRIFFSALLIADAVVTVSIGGVVQTATWDTKPDGGVGVYHGSVSFTGKSGAVIVTVTRSGAQIAQVTGSTISSSCPAGLTNWNAWVGSQQSSTAVSKTPTLSLFSQKCIKGSGANDFAGLCSFGCQYGYCPLGACYCQQQGAAKPTPSPTGAAGYPVAGKSASYSGLCAFDCVYGYCPSSACGHVQVGLTIPTVSEFLPPACIGGTGVGNLAGLCSFACNYGYCPIAACTCTAQGALNPLPAPTNQTGHQAPGQDLVYRDLCAFTCRYGYCPAGACVADSSSGGSGSGVVYIDPLIFLQPSPTVACFPPCTIVIPLSTMQSASTIRLPPVTTTVIVGVLTTITPSPVVTSVISFFNMPIGADQTEPFSFRITQSIDRPPITVTAGTITTTIILPPIATASASTSTTTVYYSLPTTDYVTAGQTIKFSEAQDTNRRSLTTPTVVTTTLPQVVTASSSTTTTSAIVILSIQSGGFYWSPVITPLPTLVIPPLIPEFPPFPSPPCFNVLGIFSFNCPPDKSKATTTFYASAPTPTCTVSTGCGKLCTTCETSSGSSCTARTATLEWVSCSSTSCKTTRTATITGCSVTNSVTTTGNYCPTGFVLDPSGVDDDDYKPPKTTTTTPAKTTAQPTTTAVQTTTTSQVVAGPTPTGFDCKGSALCGSFAFLNSYCGGAENNLVPGTTYGDANTGTCSEDGFTDGCGIFVQGTDCEFTGAQMLQASKDLYNIGGCSICGNVYYANGCRITQNYVTGCTTNLGRRQAPVLVMLNGTIPNSNFTGLQRDAGILKSSRLF